MKHMKSEREQLRWVTDCSLRYKLRGAVEVMLGTGKIISRIDSAISCLAGLLPRDFPETYQEEAEILLDIIPSGTRAILTADKRHQMGKIFKPFQKQIDKWVEVLLKLYENLLLDIGKFKLE